MKHEDYVARRRERDSEFREEQYQRKTAFSYRRAIIRARIDAGLTQADLAKRMGVGQAAIARLEQGNSVPRMDTMLRISEATGAEFCIRPGVAIEVVERREVEPVSSGVA